MRRLYAGLMVLLFGVHAIGLAAAIGEPSGATIASARDRVLPHVVSILVVREDFNQGEGNLSLSGGSGTIITPQGHILTNAHVTEKGRRFRVVLADQREFRARLVGSDPISDLAVLAIDADGQRFGHATLSEQNTLQAGDWVLAIGAPWGMANSVSLGVVNHPDRLMVSLFEDEADYEQALGPDQATARYYSWIQHDASISPGNSGGPLVDLSGRVVGVNTRGSLFGGDMAFSIPAPVADAVARALIRDGRVKRSDYGFNIRSLRGTGLSQGALVSSVDRGSAAEKAGLRPGDRILALDGAPVEVLQPEQVPPFRRALSERPIGTPIRLTVLRGTERSELSFKSVLQAEQRAEERELPDWGISVSNLTLPMARSRFLDRRDGVLITGVRPGGAAATAQPALQNGDLIVQVDGQPVTRLEQLLERHEPAAGKEHPPVVIEVLRRGQTVVAVLEPRPKRVIPERPPELAKLWAGWEVQPITPPLAAALGLPHSGFRVTRVYPDGPAARAGVAVGDLIVATLGAPVRPAGLKETSALDLRVRNAERGAPFPVEVWRPDGVRRFQLDLVEQPLPAERAERHWDELLRLVLRELTFYDRIERNLPADQAGVLVERAESGGLGGLANLREGDLIVRVGQSEVRDIEGFEQAMREAGRKKEPKLSFLVKRGADTRLLFTESPWAGDGP